MAEPCAACGRYPNRPVTSDAIVVRAGKVLLIRRGYPPFAGQLALPGGFVDQYETPAECAVRELAEETGLTGSITGLVGIYDAVDRDPARHVITFVYEIQAADTEPVASDDAAGVEWVALDGLPALAFDHNRILEEYRLGQRLVPTRGSGAGGRAPGAGGRGSEPAQ